MDRPLALLLGLQGGLLLLGGMGSLALGVPLGPKLPWALEVLLALGLFLALWGLEGLFGRLFPRSMGEAEAILRGMGPALKALGPGGVLLLAALSGMAEEVFFRGALQTLLEGLLGHPGVLLQALLFALLHPAPLRAWAYPLWAGLAGLALGLAAHLGVGLPALALAHALHNARGFYELWKRG